MASRFAVCFALCLALYGLAACALFARPGLFTGADYFGSGTDPSLYIWMFKFLPDAIYHLQNPFILQPAWAPYGLNITQSTTTPLLALLAWPLTAWAGPIVSFNLVTLAAPALAAGAACLLAHELTQDWRAAFIGGWMFGFSSAVFAPLLDHLQTDFLAFMPLSFLILMLRARGKLSPIAYAAALSAAGICQFLTSLETYVTMLPFLAVFAAWHDYAQAREATPRLLAGLAFSLLLTALITAPYSFYFFRNYAEIPHLLQNGAAYPTDLANLIIPTPITWLGGQLAAPLSARFIGNISEQLGYIGLPLACITVIAARATWHGALGKPFIISLGIALILSLGPSLRIAGMALLPLPWALLQHLPLLANALPARLMAFAMLFIAMICALWLAQRQTRSYLITIAACLFTLPAITTPGLWQTPIPTADLFQDHRSQSLIPPGSNVLFLPFTHSRHNVLFWQIIADGEFRTVNGYGNFIPPALTAWPAIAILQSPAPAASAANLAAVNQFLRATAVHTIIIRNDLSPEWTGFLTAAGWHPQTIGTLTLFRPTTMECPHPHP